MLYQDFPFSATSGGGGGQGACKPPQKVSFWEQAVGSALEEVVCFGVSLPADSQGAHRNSAACMHSAAPTEILWLLGKRLEYR